MILIVRLLEVCSTHRLTKTRLVNGELVARLAAGMSGQGCDDVAVDGRLDGDRLIFIRKVGDDRFSDDVEGAAKKDVVRGFSDDMYL